MRSYTAYAYSAGTCGATKTREWKTQDWKTQDQIRGGRKYRTGKHGNIMCIGSEA